MTSILIKNVLHGTMTTDVLIEGNHITRIASGISAPEGAEVLDGTDKAIIPGFINTHTHASMTLFRGYGDDLPLMTWLQDYIWPVEEKMTAHDVYVGAKLACLEMLRSGTTCFLDMYMHPLETAKAVEEMGLRAHLSYTLFDQGNPERAALDRKRSYEYMERFGEFSDRITFTLGPHAIYTVSGEQLQFCHQFAIEHDVKIHLHLSETKGEIDECIRLHGLTPVRYLEKLGILSEHLVLAHVVWVDDEEMELLAKHNVSVVHNPASNMKLASGYTFKYEEMKRRGIRIGIGTDGCSSSNNLDMCKADDIFASATAVGADILGLNAGRIEEGRLADVCLVDLNTPELVPLNDLTSNLVYATSGSSCIDTVIIDGRILMRDKYIPGQEAIIAEAREVAQRLFSQHR